MARDDRREGEVAVSRERLTEIATELARRAQPEYVKARAQEAADDLKARAKGAAREKVDQLKDRARETALGTVDDIKEKAMNQGKGVSVLGAVVGGALGVAAVKLLQERSERFEARRFDARSYREIGYGFEGADTEDFTAQDQGRFDEVKSKASDKLDEVKSRASGTLDEVKSRASGISERISSEAHELRDRVPSADELKTKVSGAVEDDPLIVGLGALAFGAIAGLMLPVSDAERKAYGKVRIAAQEKLHEAGGKLQEKLEGTAEQMRSAADMIGGPRTDSGERTVQAGEELQRRDEDADEGFVNHPHAEDPNLPSVH